MNKEEIRFRAVVNVHFIRTNEKAGAELFDTFLYVCYYLSFFFFRNCYFFIMNNLRGLKFCIRPYPRKLTRTQHNFGMSIGLAVDRHSSIYWQQHKWTAIFTIFAKLSFNFKLNSVESWDGLIPISSSHPPTQPTHSLCNRLTNPE